MTLLLVLGYAAGCTFLVNFDAPDAGAHDLDAGATSEDATTLTTSNDADTDAPPRVTTTDAPAGDDDDLDAGADGDLLPFPISHPSGSSPLTLAVGCGACEDFVDHDLGSVAFTCGSEQNGANSCGTSDFAVYQCDASVDTPAARLNPIQGYNCPSTERCWKAGTHNAACDPCDHVQSTGYHVTVPTYTNGSGKYCVLCYNGHASEVSACDASACTDALCIPTDDAGP